MTESEGDSDTIAMGALSVLSGDVGRLLVFAAFIPLLVRLIGDSGFGTYALVMAVFAPLRKILNFGLFEATKTFGSRTQGEEQGSVIAVSFWIHFFLAIVTIPTAAFGVVALNLSAEISLALSIVLLAAVGEQLFLFGRSVLHIHRRESLVEPLIPLRSIILAAVGLGLAANGFGVPGVFVGFATGFLLTGLLAVWLAYRQQAWKLLPSASIARERVPELLVFGAPSMGLALLTLGLVKLDVLLVAYFRPPSEVGHYRAALQLAEFIWTVPLAAQLVMIQSTAGAWERGNLERVGDVMSNSLRYVLLLTVLLVIGVFAVGETFVGVYFGSDFDPSVRPLQLLLPGIIGFAVARVVWPVLQAGGHLRIILGATGSAVAINTSLNVLLIPRYGIVGAAVATSVSYLLLGGFQLIVARQLSLRPLRTVPIGRLTLLAVFIGALLWILARQLPWYLELLIVPTVGLICYTWAAVHLRIVDWAELSSQASRLF